MLVPPDDAARVDAATITDAGSTVADDRASVSADVGNPTADCNTPRALLGNAPVYAARMTRLGDGLLVVWAAGSRTGIQAQRFDMQLRPQGFATQLGWLTGQDGVSVAMDVRDNRAVVAVQSRYTQRARLSPMGARGSTLVASSGQSVVTPRLMSEPQRPCVGDWALTGRHSPRHCRAVRSVCGLHG